MPGSQSASGLQPGTYQEETEQKLLSASSSSGCRGDAMMESRGVGGEEEGDEGSGGRGEAAGSDHRMPIFHSPHISI